MESRKEQLKILFDDNNYLNEIVLGNLLPTKVWQALPHFFQTLLRSYVLAILLYMTIGSLWSFYIYHWKRNVYVPEDKIPSNKTMLWHIGVAMKGMHWYSLVPTISEYMIENGWTLCFPRISDVGLFAYLVYTLIYLVVVEFGIYWIHRISHDFKPYYKYLHYQHHLFKDNLLSPFAGLALSPLDGVLNGVQHTLALFVVPMHFKTHLVLFLAEGIWTAHVHDNIEPNMWPLLGAKFHAIHHRVNKYNYGHYTILMDWLFGTLCYPSQQDQFNNKVI